MKLRNKKIAALVMVFALALICIPVTGKVSAASKNSNQTFSVGKLTYKVTGKNTCAVTGLTKKATNTTSCVIPSKVTCNGKTYKVTEIANNAFCNKDNLVSVKVPNSVTCVGSKAFYDCDNLKKVSLGNNVKQVKANAFNQCDALKKINCASNIKKLGSNCFGIAVCVK